MTLSFINEIVFNFMEGIYVLLFFTLLVGQRNYVLKNMLKSSLFFILFTVFGYWASTYIPKGFHTVFILAFVLTTIPFITGFNVLISAVCSSIILVTLLFSELVIAIPIMVFFKTDIGIFEAPGMQLVLGCVSKAIAFCIYFCLLRTKRTFLSQHINIRRNSPITFIAFQVLTLSMFLISTVYSSSSPSNIFVYQILIFTIGLIFISLNFLDYLEREKSLREQHKLQSQQEYVKNLEAFVSILRKEKHDYANHLSTLHTLCKLNNPDTVEKIDAYMSKLTSGISSPYLSFSTGNDYINALLAVKNNFAHDNNIALKTDFKAPVFHIAIPDSDLISILGNIIDNAYEALLSSDSNNPGKYVHISTNIVNNRYFIRISNNGPLISDKDIKRIFESGFSTKTDKRDHGFGLHIVKQNITKNNGAIKVLSSENETIFELDFSVKSNVFENSVSAKALGA